MKKKKFLSTGASIILAFTFLVGSAYAALSARPWDDAGWNSLSFSTQISQIRSWIDSNISQASSLTTKPWDESGYGSLSQAQKDSKQRDWQYLKRRVSDTYPMPIAEQSVKVLDSHSTNEYYIPEKTASEWTAFANAVNGGQVPDLSFASLANPYIINNVAVGHRNSCAITAGGRAYCWGYNTDYSAIAPQWNSEFDDGGGNVGDGGTGDRSSPSQVSGGHTDWQTIDTYHTGSCGIRNGGELYCWGRNWGGNIGDNTTNQSLVPKRVGTANDWVTVSTSAWYTCGVRGNGRAYCWGHNNEGDLGAGGSYGSYPDYHTPHEINGGYTDWENIAAGWGKACGIRNGGEVYCWGMGIGSSPQKIGSYNDWIDISVETAICGIRSNGQGYCWKAMDGYAAYEGDGDNSVEGTPQLLAGGHTWTAIGDSCGVTTQGRAYCWGDNDSARIGNGNTTTYNSPREVSGGYTDWVSVQSSDLHACGYRSNGNLYCWSRYNWYGETGTGTSSVPKLVGSITVKH